jgi:hypothetical protein
LITSSRPAPAGAHRRAAGTRIRSGLRGFALVAVLALLTLLVVKVEFKSPSSNYAFWTYGILVTAVVSTTMTVAFAFYRDPALVARARRPDLATVPGRVGWPLVSCVVAVHNEEVLVTRCLASMAAQTYPNIEIIVVDDASTDRTAAILRELARTQPVTLIELPVNRGKKGALGAGLQRARGSLIAFADSDTVWEPDAVEMAKNAGLETVVGRYYMYARGAADNPEAYPYGDPHGISDLEVNYPGDGGEAGGAGLTSPAEIAAAVHQAATYHTTLILTSPDSCAAC